MAISALLAAGCYRRCGHRPRRRARHRPRQRGAQRRERGKRRDRRRRLPHGAAHRRVEHPGRDLAQPGGIGTGQAAPRPAAGRPLDHLVGTDRSPVPWMPRVGDGHIGSRRGTVGLVPLSSTTGSACTRPSAIAPRPRRGPAWKGSPCLQLHDALIPPLHAEGGSPPCNNAQTWATQHGQSGWLNRKYLWQPSLKHTVPPFWKR